MASYRYRAQIPCEEVGKINGFKTAMNDGEADIVVFSKPSSGDLDIARKAKADGAKIVFDASDDHFGDTRFENYYEMAKLADHLVTPTPVMRARVYDYIKRDSVVIPDPYEFDEQTPHADGDNYLWFGHKANFEELKSVFKFLGSRKLRVVTGPRPPPQAIEWSPHNLSLALKASNIVILPTLRGSEYKTPNRLINAIRAGCFPICMTHPAYLEFKPMVWVGHFPTGLKWADAFKEDLNGLVREAQDYIHDRYSPKTIGETWAKFLENV